MARTKKLKAKRKGAYAWHVSRWKNCKGCVLCKTRNKIVLAKGSIPCDVLFVGEAPGTSEDIIGKPFVGPAGRLLDRIISDAFPPEIVARCAYTNLVCCLPKKDGSKLQPTPKQIEACHDRLVEFVVMSDPLLTVAVGQLSEKHLKTSLYTKKIGPIVSITHPAAILRAESIAQSLLVQRAVVTLRDALAELLP